MADTKQLSSANQIKFLHGTQAALDNMMKSTATAEDKAKIEAGAFYLTTDSHRMYLAQADKTIVPVNDSIQKIASINDLPDTKYADSSVSTFYYCIDENVLCIGIANESGGWKWVQVNPDDDTVITARTMTATKAENATALKVTDTLTTSDNKSWNAYWGFEENGGNVIVTVNEVTEGNVKRNMFTIKCKVALGTDASPTTGIIKLTDSGDDSKKVIIKPKDANTKLTITSDDDGNISIDDAQLRGDDITGITHTISTTGDIKTTITKNNNNSGIYDTFTPIIKYGKEEVTAKFLSTSDTSDTGTADLDVYTIEEVDDLIKRAKADMDAMTYMGTLDGTKPLPSGTTDIKDTDNLVCIGDTWKIATSAKRYTRDGEYAENEGELPTEGAEWAQKGDLFIAQGTEDEETGYIVSDLRWDHVPSGDDTSTSYIASLNEYGFVITENGASNATLVQFDVTGGTAISLGTDKPDSGTETDKIRTVTINHDIVERTADGTATALTQSAADLTDFVSTNEFTHVQAVSVNDQGHVIGITTQKVTLTDTNASIKEVNLDAKDTEGATNSVTLTSKVTLKHPTNPNSSADVGDDSITIKSMNSNLSVSVDNSAIALNLVWGTF